jgi:hypothetical protein
MNAGPLAVSVFGKGGISTRWSGDLYNHDIANDSNLRSMGIANAVAIALGRLGDAVTLK